MSEEKDAKIQELEAEIARLKDENSKLQEDELSEAGWYHRDEIPDETMMNSIGSELKMVFKYGSLEKFYEVTGYKDQN